MILMSASVASGGAMIWIGSPERRTSAKTTTDTTNIDTIDCSNRPTMYRCTTPLALLGSDRWERPPFERGFRPRNPLLGEVSEGAVEPPPMLTHVFVVGLRRHVGERLPAADPLAHRP